MGNLAHPDRAAASDRSLEERSMAESGGSLRKECLGFAGVSAMAIALISPTMTAALIVRPNVQQRGRCVMITLPPGDLPKDLGILKAAVHANKANVGVYATVERAGVIRGGDTVKIEAA
jgi:hypothetical protein